MTLCAQWQKLICCAGLLLSFTNTAAENNTTVSWSTETHTPHFADVNGDEISDLILQAKSDANSSSLVLGAGIETVQYLTTMQTLISVDLSQAQLAAGDFNGDGRQDLLAVSASKHGQAILHSSETGLLSVAQNVKGTVKWGKNRAEQLLVKDFNADGRDDVFAWAKAQGKSHYVVFADEAGLLQSKNTQKVDAQITGEDWQGDDYSVAAGNADADKALELVKFNNSPMWIDENGVITNGGRAANVPHQSYSLSKGKKSTTQSLVGVPAMPPLYPGVIGAVINRLAAFTPSH
jgi:hypothetical protein